MKIGLSLSRCIRDIVDGNVSEADVAVIVTNTCAPTEEIFARLIRQYSTSCWQRLSDESYSARCAAAACRLYYSGRIVQPRTLDRDYSHYAPEAWIEVPSTKASQPERRATDAPRTITIDQTTRMVCVDPGCPGPTKWKRLPIEGGETL